MSFLPYADGGEVGGVGWGGHLSPEGQTAEWKELWIHAASTTKELCDLGRVTYLL